MTQNLLVLLKQKSKIKKINAEAALDETAQKFITQFLKA
jgi:hypothetical protein